MDNSEVNDIVQSVEFQNLIRDENFRKAVLSSDFQDIIIPFMSNFQRIVLFSQDFQNILPLCQSFNTPEEMKNFFESDEFKKGLQRGFPKSIYGNAAGAGKCRSL